VSQKSAWHIVSFYSFSLEKRGKGQMKRKMERGETQELRSLLNLGR
jgi:hypothetical protein